jgi:L-amino acid N-acyltransferase YncA
MTLTLRDAQADDLPAIRDIYNDAVLNTLAIWNEQTVDLANRLAWFEARQAQGYPILVALDAAGQVLGYASFGDWRPFEGFRHTVEHSVYIHHRQRGLGVGGLLLSALIERARGCGKHVMVAAIESGNAASIRLHERLGFTLNGQMPQVGIKFGRWLDLTFMQLLLDNAAMPPSTPSLSDPAAVPSPISRQPT